MKNYKHVKKTFKILSDPATGPIVGPRLRCLLIENRNEVSADPGTSSIIGRPSSIFKASNDRRKRRKTEELRT